MARLVGKLTALRVEKEKKPGLHADGNGLYLRVTAEGAKSWVYRFMLNGTARSMGLGPVSLYGLQEAREKAHGARKLRHEGVDPIENRRGKAMQDRLEAAKAMTFSECAENYIKSHRAGWRNAKHAAQWEATLATYALPIIGALPVQAIDTALVMRVMEQEVDGAPFWTARPETASRLRGRIEAILDWAKTRNYREGENPARWKGHLDNQLPARGKVRKVVHHAALPYADLATFMVALRKQDGIAARALEFAILTAARTNEVLGARWSEINIAARMWTVPATRMKAAKEHRVPLSESAIAILDDMQKVSSGDDGGFVFPGLKRGRPLSNMALLMTLRRMKRDDLTAHGFRSTFKDWATERTNFPSEAAELALAHTVPDKVEAAYRRGDLFERRRRMMQAWADFCAKAPGEVITMAASR
jgi:integrase